MKRTYLEEDLQLIRKYFPGARTTNLRTPFDLTTRSVRHKAIPLDQLRDSSEQRQWLGETAWTH